MEKKHFFKNVRNGRGEKPLDIMSRSSSLVKRNYLHSEGNRLIIEVKNEKNEGWKDIR